MKYVKMVIIVMLLMTIYKSGFCSDIIESRGGDVRVVKYKNGNWELLVNDEPFFIKGVVFTPVKIGESPSTGSMRDWMLYDDDNDGKNDIAFQTWVDENRNNIKDKNETFLGDFQLMKDMGINTIRLYHVPSENKILGNIYKGNRSTSIQYDHAINKKLLRKLYNEYGIRVIMGNFLGSWTIGSGASWDEGTDYTNPEHRENIKKSVKAMILDNKDEPYVLFWAFGNENNIADWSKCNAKGESEAYARLIGELVDMAHQLDPNHLVAVIDGDNFNSLKRYAEFAPEIDIIGYNTYRSENHLNNLWKDAKRILDRPIFLSEIGQFAYNSKVGVDEDLQLKYIKGSWRSIVRSSHQYSTKDTALQETGNSIGVTVFDWVDRWYMDNMPFDHNKGNRKWDSPDGLAHEEWFGLVSMGDGSDSLMRQKRKAYNYLQKVWNKLDLDF